MISYPNAKINLGLNIISKRNDGYHNIETIFYPIPFYDVLEIIQTDNNNSAAVEFSSSGLTIEGKPDDNLCVKAYNLLRKDFSTLPSVIMHVHKAIPIGAGLGGGSADATFTLQLLNKKFNLNLSTEQLHYYALQLGSDCPFFLVNKPAFATQCGEQLQQANLSLKGYNLLIVNPGIHINTKWAFSQITPAPPTKNLADVIKLPVNEWKNYLVNDFEKPIFKHYPQLQDIKQKLYESGAIYASMSGSGSAVFGLYNDTAEILALTFSHDFLLNKIVL